MGDDRLVRRTAPAAVRGALRCAGSPWRRSASSRMGPDLALVAGELVGGSDVADDAVKATVVVESSSQTLSIDGSQGRTKQTVLWSRTVTDLRGDHIASLFSGYRLRRCIRSCASSRGVGLMPASTFPSAMSRFRMRYDPGERLRRIR